MSGVQDPNTVDLVTRAQDGGYPLIMIEERDWDGSEERIEQLQTKIRNYVAFALDGQLGRMYPESAGHPINVQIDCVADPDQSVARFLDEMRPRLAPLGIGLQVNVLPT